MSPEVVADWPLADVRLWDAALADVERVEALGRQAEALTLAGYVAMAMHEPKRLGDAVGDWRRSLVLVPPVTPDQAAETAEALAERLAFLKRVARRKRRKGLPLTDAETHALGD